MKISAVINTYNEERNLERCLKSLKGFADEIVVVDMGSSDNTKEIAEKHDAKIYSFEYTRFVEPARNFAVSKAKNQWVLVLDADEELPSSLGKKLIQIAKENEADFVEIPRKNIIFGKWINHSRWWPDCLVRFFKKNKVHFSDKIHVPPTTEGKGFLLEAKEEWAIVHHNFQSISQFVERLNRYTDIQSDELVKKGYSFGWRDLVVKPAEEFFSRFFSGEGYKDGIHGLSLALLQAFSELVLYLKVWEKGGFKQEELKNWPAVFLKKINEFLYWQAKVSQNGFKRMLLKLKAKI